MVVCEVYQGSNRQVARIDVDETYETLKATQQKRGHSQDQHFPVDFNKASEKKSKTS